MTLSRFSKKSPSLEKCGTITRPFMTARLGQGVGSEAGRRDTAHKSI